MNIFNMLNILSIYAELLQILVFIYILGVLINFGVIEGDAGAILWGKFETDRQRHLWVKFEITPDSMAVLILDGRTTVSRGIPV